MHHCKCPPVLNSKKDLSLIISSKHLITSLNLVNSICIHFSKRS